MSTHLARRIAACLLAAGLGGQALATGGNFYELRQFSDADWQAARERIEAQNARDRAQRS